MVLKFYCDKCDNVIRLKLSPFVDVGTRLHNIKRPWMAVTNELSKYHWTFDDEGRAFCPDHSRKSIDKFNSRINQSKEFLESQQMIGKSTHISFELPVREQERFKLAVFFVDQNIQETVSFLFKQFADYVLSGNIREKSEKAYQDFIEKTERRKIEQEEEREHLIKLITEKYFSKDIPPEQARKMAVNLLKSNDWNIGQALGIAKIQ